MYKDDNPFNQSGDPYIDIDPDEGDILPGSGNLTGADRQKSSPRGQMLNNVGGLMKVDHGTASHMNGSTHTTIRQ